MSDIKKGDIVRIKVVVPQGPVEKFMMLEDGTIMCLVSWQDSNGATQQRWFPKDELEKV